MSLTDPGVFFVATERQLSKSSLLSLRNDSGSEANEESSKTSKKEAFAALALESNSFGDKTLLSLSTPLGVTSDAPGGTVGRQEKQ